MRTLSVALLLGAFAACGGAEPTSDKSEDKPEAAEAAAEGEKAITAEAKAGGECLHDKVDDANCAGTEVPDKGTEGHFGDPFALEESKPLSNVIETLASVGDAPVQVSGEVDQVCQKMGCWMVIKDGDQQARVLMKDHKFAVPFDGKGKKAVVEGTIVAKELSEAQIKHIEEDAGRDPSKVEGTRKEYVLTASGVKLES
jgi:hypothetical protein